MPELGTDRLQGPRGRERAPAGLVLGSPSAPAWAERQPRS